MCESWWSPHFVSDLSPLNGQFLCSVFIVVLFCFCLCWPHAITNVACFDIQASKFICEHFGHCIKFSKDSNVF